MSFPKPSDLSFYFCTAHFSHSLSLGLSQGPGVEVVRVVGVKDPLTLYLWSVYRWSICSFDQILKVRVQSRFWPTALRPFLMQKPLHPWAAVRHTGQVDRRTPGTHLHNRVSSWPLYTCKWLRRGLLKEWGQFRQHEDSFHWSKWYHKYFLHLQQKTVIVSLT